MNRQYVTKAVGLPDDGPVKLGLQKALAAKSITSPREFKTFLEYLNSLTGGRVARGPAPRRS
jgi:hypothetical protein